MGTKKIRNNKLRDAISLRYDNMTGESRHINNNNGVTPQNSNRKEEGGMEGDISE